MLWYDSFRDMRRTTSWYERSWLVKVDEWARLGRYFRYYLWFHGSVWSIRELQPWSHFFEVCCHRCWYRWMELPRCCFPRLEALRGRETNHWFTCWVLPSYLHMCRGSQGNLPDLQLKWWCRRSYVILLQQTHAKKRGGFRRRRRRSKRRGGSNNCCHLNWIGYQ